MHVKLGVGDAMRTTIEITSEHREKLVALAARRRMKGFSGLIREALEMYLEAQERERDGVARALAVRGALDEDEAGQMREAARLLRESWR
jgi:predicted transcriptional regulator